MGNGHLTKAFGAVLIGLCLVSCRASPPGPALNKATEFAALVGAGKYKEAYALCSQRYQDHTSFKEFSDIASQAGPGGRTVTVLETKFSSRQDIDATTFYEAGTKSIGWFSAKMSRPKGFIVMHIGEKEGVPVIGSFGCQGTAIPD